MSSQRIFGSHRLGESGKANKAMKMFPIMGSDPIPWSVIEPHDSQARFNHCGQSLERLAERGGLSANEAICVLENRPWTATPDGKYAEQCLRAIINNRQSATEAAKESVTS